MTDPIFQDMPEVEHGIPIPVPGNGGGKAWSPFLRHMRNGDSFLVPDVAARDCVLRAAGWTGILVTTRKVSGKGYRIWRIGKRRK